MTRPIAALAAVLLGLLGLPARADVAKRPMPDYSGRGDAPADAGDVLIWVPRVIVSPVYFVSEFVIRRPIGALLSAIEQNHVVNTVGNLFGIGQPIGFVPTFYYDLAVHPHFGIYFFWDGFLTPPNALRVSASGGLDFLAATVTDRLSFSTDWRLAFRFAASSRSDAIFFGIGPGTATDRESRYEIRHLDGSVAVETGPSNERIRIEVGERDVTFGGDSCCDEPSLVQAVALGFYPLPFGFSDGGYQGPYGRLRLVLDAREELPATGVGIALDGELGSDVARDRAWLRAGASLTGSVDLDRHRRVVSLVVDAQMVEPVAGPDVPFTELVALGGNGPLPAFPGGQLLGRSRLDATLAYEWPIWVYLVGVAHVAVGNVFGERFTDYDAGLLRLSAGLGIRSIGSIDHRFQLLVAVGTKPFLYGGGIDSVRLVIGSITGF